MPDVKEEMTFAVVPQFVPGHRCRVGLPGRGFGAGAHTRNEPITRLVSVADAIGRSLRNTSWPPASRPDRRMIQMTRPVQAARYASVVASGRSDFPNQINNVLAFPGVFRGLLDARASQ